MKKILSNQAVKKFMHNRKAVLGLIIVCFLVFGSHPDPDIHEARPIYD